MTTVKNLVGEQFGRLLVIARSANDKRGHTKWECVCQCGTTTIVLGDSLRRGVTQSCGCLHKEGVRSLRFRHGMTNTRCYRIWQGMLARCLNPRHKNYKDYGGRGIAVCAQWMVFENFYTDMGDPLVGKTLERNDNNGDYGKDNCRWATRAEQAINTRWNKFLTFNGRTQTMAQWARELKLSGACLTQRFKRGWSLEQALTTKSLSPADRKHDSNGRMSRHHSNDALKPTKALPVDST